MGRTILCAATALLIAWLWLTPYRYECPHGVIRIHRLTGKAEALVNVNGVLTWSVNDSAQ